jgi:3-mercaptopyruvate sulfurtransferase SseA
VAQTLFGIGFMKVFALKDGWDAWEKTGYPVEPK